MKRLSKRAARRRAVLVASTAYVAALLAAGYCGAANLEAESHDRLAATASAHALAIVRASAPPGASISVEASGLDNRLRLPRCGSAPVAFDPPGQRPGGNMTVGVRCNDTATSWSLYVPVRVEVLADVLVLTAPLGRGEQPSAAHLSMEPRNLATLGTGYMTDLNAVEGKVMRRAVRPGMAITPDMLEPARLVRRGERVVIWSGQSGFAVQGEGEALADAAEGQRLRVRNLRSGRVIEGTVAANGTVIAGR